MSSVQPFIGVFDSGIGGLTVANSIRALLPMEQMFYVADNARAPYGPQPPAQILAYSMEITNYLVRAGAKMIVVACNTATSVAINQLRASFPGIPFVGMEPAVKPAALGSTNGKVGVLATALTLGSERYQHLVSRYAQEVTVYEDPCLGLVPLIEAGEWHTRGTHQLLETILAPMLAENIDTLVLGCTHYPLLLPLIEQIVGPGVRLINPAPAAAKQVERLLINGDLLQTGSNYPPLHRFFSTGAGVALQDTLIQLDFKSRLVVPFHQLKEG